MRLAVTTFVIALVSQSAGADEPTEDPPVESYQGRILAADAMAVGIFIAGVATEQSEILIFSAPMYMLISPAMHVSNDRSSHAVGSLLMRAGVPLLGYAVGQKIDGGCGSGCGGPSSAGLSGFVGGAVVASVLDVIFLAQGDERRADQPLAWSPVAGPTQEGGVALGVAGQF